MALTLVRSRLKARWTFVSNVPFNLFKGGISTRRRTFPQLLHRCSVQILAFTRSNQSTVDVGDREQGEAPKRCISITNAINLRILKADQMTHGKYKHSVDIRKVMVVPIE